MSIRHYECMQCCEVFDILCKNEEACTVHCPRCLSEARMIFPASHLRGSGFYATDARAGNRRTTESGGKQAEKPNPVKKGKLKNN